MVPSQRRSRFATLERLMGRGGFILPMAITFTLVFMLAAAALTVYATNSAKISRFQTGRLRALYMAEAATEKVVAAIRLYAFKNGTLPASYSAITAQPGTGGLFNFTTYSVSSSTLTYQMLNSGDYIGLNGNVQTITVNAAARATSGFTTATATVQQQIQVQHIPVFQFGIFYQNDLEIGPGVNMTFAGPVHSNSNIYVTADNGVSLTFDSTITAAGAINHALKEGGSMSGVMGDVFIKDSDNTNQNMKLGDNTWLDSSHADWLLQSQTRWDGNLQAGVHGARTLQLPIPTGSQPHALVERRVTGESTTLQAQKLDYKAHLRFVDGVAQNQAGTTVELRYCSGGGTFNPAGSGSCPGSQTVRNPISNSTFYDYREAKTIRAMNVDVNLLRSSPNFISMVNANNGVIVYSSDRRYSSGSEESGLRLINGSQLPTKGLTFASEQPLYVKGSYNTTSKQPSGMVSDSFNVQSSNWVDANSTQTMTNRNAASTTINTAIISGNTESTTGHYNGGIENIIRLMENWSGDTLTYSGSIAILYNSTIGANQWGASNVYSPPTRVWSYDTGFSSPSYNIPGFPSIFNIIKSSYEQT